MTRLAYTLPLLAWLLQAQQQPGGPTRPAPPIFQALDANQDGVISAGELAHAPAALLKLDANGDGRLTPDEYRPKRPDGGGARGGGRGPEGSLEQLRGKALSPSADGPDAFLPDSGSDAEGGSTEAQPKPADQEQKPPRPKIDTALDVNGDEIIDAGEIANATALLKKLDANGDGKLSMDECFGRPAGNRAQKEASR